MLWFQVWIPAKTETYDARTIIDRKSALQFRIRVYKSKTNSLKKPCIFPTAYQPIQITSPLINTTMSSLLQPIVIGDKLPLRNRVVMSALTRNRCVDNYKPGPSQVRYYTDRAKHGTGLIVTEGVLVDWGGCNFPFTPIMVHDDHVEAWREVVQSVHKEGGKIFLQAWHLGT